MTLACQRHSQLFNFLDKLKVHVIEAARTLMAQVDAGTYEVRESMSKAEKHIVQSSEEIREDYRLNKISASSLLANAACHFDNSVVQKVFSELRENPPTRNQENAQEQEVDPDEPEEREEQGGDQEAGNGDSEERVEEPDPNQDGGKYLMLSSRRSTFDSDNLNNYSLAISV